MDKRRSVTVSYDEKPAFRPSRTLPPTYYVIPAQAGIQKGEMRQPCVYLPASQRNGILYTGVTRPWVWEHKNDQAEGYKHRVYHRVYFEQHEDRSPAKTGQEMETSLSATPD